MRKYKFWRYGHLKLWRLFRWVFCVCKFRVTFRGRHFLQILYEHETDCCGQLAILHMHSAFAVEYFSLSVFELLALWIRNLFFCTLSTGNLRAASPKYQLDLEIAKKIEFLQTRPEWSPTGISYKNIVLSSINQKLFFSAIFSFRCPKSAKIYRKWAAYSEARKLKSKNLHYKLIVRRICTSFFVYLELNRSWFD